MVGKRGFRLVAAVVMLAAGVLLPAAPARAEDVQAEQWYLAALRIPEVHRLTTGQGVVVAVVDSGVQADHPDLAGQVLDGTDLTGNDTKGKVDRKDHGTPVAGLIAARGGGPGHALGIAPGAKILPIRVAYDLPGGYHLTEAVHFAVEHGARVINLSNGTPKVGPLDVDAVRYALAHDVVVVAAVGNTAQGVFQVQSPAAIPGVIAVSATDRTGAFWSGSASGPEVVLSAPGVQIEALASHQANGRPGGYTNQPGGTSLATPIVAAAAALVRSRYPQLHAPDVVNRLIRTADDAGPSGRDAQYGFGRLDIYRALTADVAPVSANPLIAASPTPAAAQGVTRNSGLLVVALAVAAGLVLVVGVVVVVLVVRRSG